MHHRVLVRKLNSPADLNKQFQTSVQSEPVFANKLGDRHAGNVFHDEIRQTILGRSRVDQPGDVRVLEPGQNLPLCLKPTKYLIGIGPTPEQFNRHLLFELPIGPGSEVNAAHSTVPYFTDDLISAEPMTKRIRGYGAPDCGTKVVRECLQLIRHWLQKRIDL